MRLLIITQKVDKEDSILGFMHNWILELSKKFEKITVICLEKREFDLPQNIKIYSLGKESGKARIKYIKNFFNLILGLHKEYDSVFVHMNQEYVLLGGFLWKILRKKIYFWRNHQLGNLFTRIAVWFSNKVFCNSKFAFVAKYEKTILMPVGIDTGVFNPESRIQNLESRKRSILFLSRMDPIKRPDLLIEALNILNKKNFCNGVANHETPKIYKEHDIFVNLTPSGSFDKTILEAVVCGCLLVVANKSLVGEIDDRMIAKNETVAEIAQKIESLLDIGNEERFVLSASLQKYVLEKHSLSVLIEKLVKEIQNVQK